MVDSCNSLLEIIIWNSQRDVFILCRMQNIGNQGHMVSQMVDVVDKITRSRMMSGIRSKNTKPEILTRSALHRRGYRFRLDSKVKVKRN